MSHVKTIDHRKQNSHSSLRGWKLYSIDAFSNYPIEIWQHQLLKIMRVENATLFRQLYFKTFFFVHIFLLVLLFFFLDGS
jgi:hypothetical protein